jgi:hypothetical protein
MTVDKLSIELRATLGVLLSDGTTRPGRGIWEIVKSLKEALINGTQWFILADDARWNRASN